MAYDFPASPTNGQTYSSGGVTFTYNGVSWIPTGTAGVSEAPTDGKTYKRRGSTPAWVTDTISTSVPSGGVDGDIWYQVT